MKAHKHTCVAGLFQTDRRRKYQFCLMLAMILIVARTGHAEPPATPGPAGERAENTRSTIKNPFISRLSSRPGRLVVNLQAGSLHDEGAGVAVGYVPWGFLEVKASYAYGTEHSLAGFFKFNILPSAPLTPYIPVGYDLGIANMPGGLRLWTHRVFGGAGLQARILDRFFVAGEITANVILLHVLWDRSETYHVPPSDPLAVRVGFLAGVYLL
jgi:hypothetical protein